MSVMTSAPRKLPIYRPVAVHDVDGSFSESVTSSDESYSDSYSDHSDEISEETEWEQEVNPKGELFFVRASAAEGRSERAVTGDAAASDDHVRSSTLEHTSDVGRRSPRGGDGSPHSSPALSAASSSSSASSQPGHGRQELKKFHHRLRWNKRGASSTLTAEEIVPSFESTEAGGAGACFPTPQSVTEVILNTHVRQANLGRRSSALETLVGIIPGRHHSKISGSQENGNHGHRSKDPYSGTVMVQAVVPGSEASRHPGIRIGDWLYKFNDDLVTWENLDHVLSPFMSPAKSEQVKLTLSKLVASPKAAAKPREEPLRAITEHSELLLPKMLSGDDEKWTQLTSAFSSVPHIVLYLTLASTENSNIKDDILYQYPQGNSKIASFRGALMTLCHMIPDVIGCAPVSSLVLVGGQLVHIGYATEGQEIFLVALPAECITAFQVVELVKNLVCTLKYQYGSLNKAFSDATNLAGLDHTFSITLTSHLLGKESIKISNKISTVGMSSGVTSHFDLPQWLPLSGDVQSCIDGVLSELESSDFADLSEDHYDMRRLYCILGTSLFYKDYLVTNHLPDGEINNVFRYLHYSGILEMSRQSQTMEVVIWKEVFLEATIPAVTAATRWFLLVVGKNHCLLSLLLEAGGCASKASGSRGPDPFYVEQAQSSLLQLDMKQVPKSIESWLDFPTSPAVAKVETFFSRSKKVSKTLVPRNNIDRTTDVSAKPGSSPSKLPFGPAIKKQFGQPDNGNAIGKTKDGHGETDSDSTSLSLTASGTSEDTTPILGRRGQLQIPQPLDARPRWTWSDGDSPNEEDEGDGAPNGRARYRGRRYLPSQLDLLSLSDIHQSSARDHAAPPSKLTAGYQNVLFHYLQVNVADGILICPVDCSRDDTGRHELQSQIVDNFKSSCLIIQQVLHLQSDMDKDSDGADCDTDSTFMEHGMMFQCEVANSAETNRGSDFLCYWVVGRLFTSPYPKEVYVCYHSSASQSMVEIAFQLAFGLNC